MKLKLRVLLTQLGEWVAARSWESTGETVPHPSLDSSAVNPKGKGVFKETLAWKRCPLEKETKQTDQSFE